MNGAAGSLATVLAAVCATAAVVLAVHGRRSLPPAAVPGQHPELAAQRPPRTRRLRGIATAAAALAVVLLVPGWVGATGAVATGVLVWRASRGWESAEERRRRVTLERELPHLVDLLVAALHVGAAPAEALHRVAAVVGGPVADEVAVWLARLRLGADPVGVWSAMARHPQLGRLGATLARSAESGAPVAEALERLAEELTDRARAEVETRVRQVEVTAAVPLGVCLLPAFVLTGVVPLVAGAAMRLLG